MTNKEERELGDIIESINNLKITIPRLDSGKVHTNWTERSYFPRFSIFAFGKNMLIYYNDLKM